MFKRKIFYSSLIIYFIPYLASYEYCMYAQMFSTHKGTIILITNEKKLFLLMVI